MLDQVVTGKVTFASMKPCDLSNCTKQQIKEYFLNSYDLNESLFTGLKDESVFYEYPDRLRLPLVFYYGHTAVVYVNKLMLTGLIKPSDRIDFEMESILETGVDEMSWDDTENYRMGGKFKWPKICEVVEYRRKVKSLILKLIEDTPLDLPVTQDSPWWGLFMGMEHERIHLETSSVLIRQLPAFMVSKPLDWKYAPATFGDGVGLKNPILKVQETTVTLGKPQNFPSYGWDNEYGHVEIKVPDFEASKYPITNGQFLEFVLAGGYEDRTFWSEEGWNWVKYMQANHPTFWVCDSGCKSGCGGELLSHSHCKPQSRLTNGQNSYCNGHSVVDGNGHQGKDEGGGATYRLRLVFDVVDMKHDWPVEVNYHEAKAYCAWKGPDFRLPTEAEHNAMRGPQLSPDIGTQCDIIFQDTNDANFNMQFGSSTPVNMYGENSEGFHDLFGNVWEWVEDHFNGLPGGSTHFLYDDFSSPCYDGRHTVILGGSWISTGDEASRFARYAFRRHFFQHCGFRVARSVPKDEGKVLLPVRLITNDIYILGGGIQDNPIILDTSKLDFEGGKSTNWQLEYEFSDSLNTMLEDDWGSSGATYAESLAEVCSKAVIKHETARQRALHIGCGTGSITTLLGDKFKEILGVDYCGQFIDTCYALQAGESIPYFTNCSGDKRNKMEVKVNIPANVHFKQLTWLPNEIDHFDFILMTFLERALNPKAWLLRMREILKSGGLLIIASKGKWDQQNLKPILGPYLECVETQKIEPAGGSDKVNHKVTFWQHK